MFTCMILALAITTQDSSARHVRASEPRILTLIDAGTLGSVTFRGLIATLNESDVIVYIEPKLTRRALGGHLAHNIVAQGQYRYLHIAVEIAGSERRLVSLLAHEPHHAVEVAQAPDAHDAESLERLFSRLAMKFGCSGGTTCFETQAAKDVESIVKEELASSSPSLQRAFAIDAPRIPRVRDNGDPVIAALLQEATEHSATFRRLVETIDATDGIVYVERGMCRHSVRACLALKLLGSTGFCGLS
jgi:hypothetical protein